MRTQYAPLFGVPLNPVFPLRAVSFWLTFRLQLDVAESQEPIPRPNAATVDGEMLVYPARSE
jgi:hypothetical protein